jgi:hypothetical protein
MNCLLLLKQRGRGFDIWGMEVCMCLFCICVGQCVARGVLTGWFPGQGVIPNLYMIRKLKKRPRPNKRLYIHNNKKIICKNTYERNIIVQVCDFIQLHLLSDNYIEVVTKDSHCRWIVGGYGMTLADQIHFPDCNAGTVAYRSLCKLFIFSSVIVYCLASFTEYTYNERFHV